jgi:hypothetical protein
MGLRYTTARPWSVASDFDVASFEKPLEVRIVRPKTTLAIKPQMLIAGRAI